jgi:hypothetical protein
VLVPVWVGVGLGEEGRIWVAHLVI